MATAMSEVDHPVLAESRRRAIFAALVTTQDHGYAVSVSRAAVAARFCLEPDLIVEIEREEIRKRWPPL